jgi:crotonobetainyl-CoA:carnitine CoA-transferase CaiB-like acyl-CoA transferase
MDLTGTVRQGFVPVPAANSGNGGLASYNIYRTVDGRFLTLGIVEEKFWRNFCVSVGHLEWIDRLNDPMPQQALISELAAMFATRPLAEWQAILDGTETCFHAVVSHTEIQRHQHVQERKMLEVRAGTDGFVDVLFPAWIDGRPPVTRRPVREIDIATAAALWR